MSRAFFNFFQMNDHQLARIKEPRNCRRVGTARRYHQTVVIQTAVILRKYPAAAADKSLAKKPDLSAVVMSRQDQVNVGFSDPLVIIFGVVAQQNAEALPAR